ncbi:hypothetical protein PQX77_009861 [Marasmius sp. AFHP31]|nr:hypothetical protein PQX77_009861 [Marasmius sp. AFHP31]
MARLATRLTKFLNIQSPIIVPPMALVGNGTLAANAHLGGGFGFIPAGYKSQEWIQSEIDIARNLLPRSESSRVPIGIGFFGWELDKSVSDDIITLGLANNVQALWFSFGNDLEKYVKFVREHPMGKETAVFVLASTIAEGKSIIQDWKFKPDVLVCQGNESGGHGNSDSPLLSVLLPTIISLLPPSSPIIPIAAGGLTTSSHIASILTLGAQAAVLGTRFLLTPEATYPNHFKSLLLNSTSANTIRTTAFDRARGTTEWPAGVDGRGIINATVRDFDAGAEEHVLVAKYKEAMETKDTNRVVVWSGTGVGLIEDVKPTKDLVRELTEGCIQQLKVVSKMLDD